MQAKDLGLERVARDSGAILFGVGDINDLKGSFENLPEETCQGLDIGISIGVKVSARILEDIDDHPTRLYMHHYKSLNILIDQISLKLSSIIEEGGFDAIPIPASQIVDWEKQTAHLSHKMIAVRAGLGWIGRSNLIINPRYGAAVRYGSILTNMPLTVDTNGQARGYLPSEREGEGATQAPMVDHPVDDGCGDCYKCIAACPAFAIKESYRDYDMISCMNKLKWFQKNYSIQHYICGICVKICKGRGYGIDQDA